MFNKKCKWCGKKFTSRSRSYLCCSEDCSRLHQNKQKRLYYKQNKDKSVERGWKKQGIKNFTLDDYKKLLAAQDNRCLICGKKDSYLGKKLQVDHNHSTGNVRGLLCLSCNAGIGSLGDDIKTVFSALIYLIKNN